MVSLAPSEAAAQGVKHWMIETGTHEYADTLETPNASDKSAKELEKLAKRARKHGLDVGAGQLLFLDHVSTPSLGVNSLKNVQDCHGPENAKYCAELDTIFAAQMQMKACQNFSSGMVSMFTGLVRTYVKRDCVRDATSNAVALARVTLADDRNLGWVVGALQIASSCKVVGGTYCDVEDMSLRNSFVADLMNDLKKGPKPIVWKTTSRILFNDQPLDLGIPAPNQEKSKTAIEMVTGEFRMSIAAQNALPGKMIIEFPDQNMGIIYPIRGTLSEFARDQARSACAGRHGTLIEDDQDRNGSIHSGMMDYAHSTYVYYIAACQIAEL